jgi:hypothetical protein
MVMMMVVVMLVGTGDRRCGNSQREKSCENIGE